MTANKLPKSPSKSPMPQSQRDRLSAAVKRSWAQRRAAINAAVGEPSGPGGPGPRPAQDFSKLTVEMLMTEIHATETRLERLERALSLRLGSLNLERRPNHPATEEAADAAVPPQGAISHPAAA